MSAQANRQTSPIAGRGPAIAPKGILLASRLLGSAVKRDERPSLVGLYIKPLKFSFSKRCSWYNTRGLYEGSGRRGEEKKRNLNMQMNINAVMKSHFLPGP